MASPGPRVRRHLSDVDCCILALTAAGGAVAARPVPLLPAALLAAVAVAVRRPGLLAVAVLLAASGLASRAEAGMEPPAPGPVAGPASLVGDPWTVPGGVRVLARLDGRRVEVTARGAGDGALAQALAGERVHLQGRLAPIGSGGHGLRVLHVVGRVEATRVEVLGPGSAPWRAANRVRRTFAAGLQGLPAGRRALAAGLVLGDDRGQAATVTDDFRGSGLAHLTAVSGQNVGLLVTLAGPVLRRVGIAPRLALTLFLVAGLVVVTRAEASVVRAAAMAAVAATATATGRPASGVRVLALAVTGLLLLDPFLVRSVGFQLSVAASGGILVLGPRLRARLPGPGAVADAVAVTAAAQVAVAPLLVGYFDGVPVVGLPANLAAAPVAGVAMAWGMAVGLPAGFTGGGAARVLHAPTGLGVGWVARVARWGASQPWGSLRAPHVAVLAVALLVATVARRPRLRAAAAVIATCALLHPALVLRHPPLRSEPVPGVEVWRAGPATVLVAGGGVHAGDLLAGLRRAGVRRVDLLVLAGERPAVRGVAAVVAHRWPPRRVLAGRAAAGAGALVDSPQALVVGPLRVSVSPAGAGLRTDVGLVGPSG